MTTKARPDGPDREEPSRLSREGIFRLNIGLGKASFRRVVANLVAPNYAVLDTLIPHPVYAKQHWVAILNPSESTLEETIWPLLTEAHDRLARVRKRQNEARL